MESDPLIAVDQHWALLAVIFGAAAVGIWSEKTRMGSRVSGAVVTIAVTFLLSNLGIIPVDAPSYGIIWSYFVPLAIPLLLFKADLRRIVREAGPTLIAFALGAVGTMIGTVVASLLVPLGDQGWKLASIFCATYIGGSMNFNAAAQATDLQDKDLLAAGIAADNLAMVFYFLVLFAVASSVTLRRLYPEREQDDPGQAGGSPKGFWEGKNLTLRDATFSLALSAILCAIGFALGDLIGVRGTGILILTALVVFLATVFPARMGKIQGSEVLGALLMQVFFAVIGAGASIVLVVKAGGGLFVFAGVILTIHLLFLLLAGKVARLDLREIVVASNANMGGPTTAAAMAVARRWNDLVTPAILCGTLGYAIATFLGVGLGKLLE